MRKWLSALALMGLGCNSATAPDPACRPYDPMPPSPSTGAVRHIDNRDPNHLTWRWLDSCNGGFAVYGYEVWLYTCADGWTHTETGISGSNTRCGGVLKIGQ
jgi:hypothetical protein